MVHLGHSCSAQHVDQCTVDQLQFYRLISSVLLPGGSFGCWSPQRDWVCSGDPCFHSNDLFGWSIGSSVRGSFFSEVLWRISLANQFPLINSNWFQSNYPDRIHICVCWRHHQMYQHLPRPQRFNPQRHSILAGIRCSALDWHREPNGILLALQGCPRLVPEEPSPIYHR